MAGDAFNQVVRLQTFRLQEADHLYDWCLNDKEDLIRVDPDWNLVEDIPLRTGVLRVSHARWTTEYKTYKECNKVWKAAARKAKILRKELEDYLREAVDEIRETGKFALRKKKERQKGYYSEYVCKVNQKKKRKRPSSEDK